MSDINVNINVECGGKRISAEQYADHPTTGGPAFVESTEKPTAATAKHNPLMWKVPPGTRVKGWREYFERLE